MDKYVESLKKDLIEQFRGKPNIEVLARALARQLQEVFDFFEEIGQDRGLYTAVGSQLDGVGDIVVLNRAEASQLAGFTKNPDEVIDDENYRKYLIFKVLKNTCDCTYPDIIKAFKMFWDGPLYYSEDPEIPATMIMKTGTLTPEMPPDKLLSAPVVKAAGVGVRIIATTETPEMQSVVYISAVMGQGVVSTILPALEQIYSFETNVYTGVAPATTRMVTDLQTIGVGFAGSEHIATAVSSVNVSRKLKDLEQEG